MCPNRLAMVLGALAMGACILQRPGDPSAREVQVLEQREAGVQDRITATRRLAALGPAAAAATPALIATFEEPGRPLRAAAAETLAHLGPGVVRPLVEALGSPDEGTREYAAYALLLVASSRDAREAGPALIRAMGDERRNVRVHALRALWFATDRDDPDAIRVTLEALHDEYYAVRHSAAYELGWRRVGRAVPALVETLDDPHPMVREAARDALREIGTADALEALRRAAP